MTEKVDQARRKTAFNSKVRRQVYKLGSVGERNSIKDENLSGLQLNRLRQSLERTLGSIMAGADPRSSISSPLKQRRTEPLMQTAMRTGDRRISKVISQETRAPQVFKQEIDSVKKRMSLVLDPINNKRNSKLELSAQPGSPTKNKKFVSQVDRKRAELIKEKSK